MTESFPPPPAFAADQVMSASGHLNLLRACVLYLLGMYQQGQGVWPRQYEEPVLLTDDWGRWWDGWLRRDGATLAYSMTVLKHPTQAREVRILYNNVDLTPHLSVPAGGGSVTLTGTKTLTGTTDGEFYAIQVDLSHMSYANRSVDIAYLRQSNPPSYPTLAAFASGTPTAGQWQALSDTAQLLYDAMRQPVPVMAARYIGMDGEYRTTVTHRSQTLFYRARWRPPFDGTGWTPPTDSDPEGDPGTYGTTRYSQWLSIWIDGVQLAVIGGQGFLFDAWTAADATTIHGFTNLKSSDVLKMKGSDELIKLGTLVGDNWTGCTRGYLGTTAKGYGAGTRGEFWQEGAEVNWPGGFKWEYSGTLDLSSLGLSSDVDYELSFVVTNENHGDRGDMYGGVIVQTLGEQADDLGVPTWWTNVEAWSHGTMVNGTAGVKALRDNLAALTGRLTAYNYPTLVNRPLNGGTIRRQHRILHYRCEVEGDKKLGPSIAYRTNKRQEIGLPFEPNKWLSYDLDNAKGLWVGTEYEFHDVTCALEDVD